MQRRTAAEPECSSYHIFYHARLDQPLLQLVYPAVRELWLRGRCRRFFFIRYGLGGPHLRLRLFCGRAAAKEVDLLVWRRAAAFFARSPSGKSWSEDSIRERNRRILARDGDGVDAVYPDNSIAKVPFRPEVERYGGDELLGHSLAFFAVSSVHALRLVEAHASDDKPRFLAAALRALLRQALGSAADVAELHGLLADGHVPDGRSLPIQRADAEFARQPDAYAGLLAAEIEALRERTSPDGQCRREDFMLTEAALRLYACLRDTSGSRRQQILSSQLHMTANRIGLQGWEEIYLRRILCKAVQHLSRADPAAWGCLRQAALPQEEAAGAKLEDLAAACLEGLFAAPAKRGSHATG
jgi:Lantibiotic biosynthesis dehydratase C-term